MVFGKSGLLAVVALILTATSFENPAHAGWLFSRKKKQQTTNTVDATTSPSDQSFQTPRLNGVTRGDIKFRMGKNSWGEDVYVTEGGKGTDTLVGTACSVLGRSTSENVAWVKRPGTDEEYGLRGLSAPGFDPLRFDGASQYRSLNFKLPENPNHEVKVLPNGVQKTFVDPYNDKNLDPECSQKLREVVKLASDEWSRSYSEYMVGQLQIDDNAEKKLRQTCAAPIANGSQLIGEVLNAANTTAASYRRSQVDRTITVASQDEYVRQRDQIEARGGLRVSRGGGFMDSDFGKSCTALVQCLRPSMKEAQTELDFYRQERGGKLAALHSEKSAALQKVVDQLFAQGGVCPNRRAASLVGVTGNAPAVRSDSKSAE